MPTIMSTIVKAYDVPKEYNVVAKKNGKNEIYISDKDYNICVLNIRKYLESHGKDYRSIIIDSLNEHLG